MGRAVEQQRDPGMAKAVKFLRALRDWSQHDLARASGIGQDQISRYERGKVVPSPGSLQRMAAAASVPFSLVELALPYLRGAASAEPGDLPPGEGMEAPGSALVDAIWGVLEAEAFEALRVLALGAASQETVAPPSVADRSATDRLWAYLKDLAEEDQILVVEHGRDYQTWAFAERLAAESERAAAVDSRKAIALARLAARAAVRIEGERGWRSRVTGYVRAHLGNARRVANDHAGAARAFVSARRLWEAGEGADPAGLLDPARPLDLEASLRRAERRFEEALDLHDRALAVAPPSSAVYVLLNKAGTLQQAGRHERALAILAEATARIDGERQPRLLFGLDFNRATNLWHLGRYEEAAALLPLVRSMADRLDLDLDLLRVRWLEARVAAGLGRRDGAVSALEEVAKAFAARGLPYDMALASLDLAALYLEDGRTAEVKALAARMIAVFMAQKVGREVVMALQTFERAVRAERATAELGRRLGLYLEQARHDPRLRFCS